MCCEFDFKRMTHFACPGPKPVPITKANVEFKFHSFLQPWRGARSVGDARSRRLGNAFRRLASIYKRDVILVVFGDDFRFVDLEEWHQQHDNLSPLFEVPTIVPPVAQ